MGRTQVYEFSTCDSAHHSGAIVLHRSNTGVEVLSPAIIRMYEVYFCIILELVPYWWYLEEEAHRLYQRNQ
jgi:hypothetical protein